jgi:hypothetical protein
MHLQKIISLVGFINDDLIDATKAQETFEALRIKNIMYIDTVWKEQLLCLFLFQPPAFN